MHRALLLAALLVGAFASPAVAQDPSTEAELRLLVPYSDMLREIPGLTWSDYNDAIREVARRSRRQTLPEPTYAPPPVYRPRTSASTRPTYRTPRSGSSYDWQSGNTYFWRRDSSGNTDVNGMNFNTGSMWNTKIKPNGSMTGFDSDMNMWNYDARSKTYMNFGTGTICIGEGFARVCTP